MQKLSLLVIVVFTLLLPFGMKAQKYDLAAGLRWGGDFGVSISERVGKRLTLEQNFNSEDKNNYYSAFALIKYHQPIITNRFNLFYGGGVGVVKLKEVNDIPESSSLSLIFQTGLEHTIKRATFYVALEPYFYQANSGARFKMHKVFAVKYVIVKRKSKWKKKLKKAVSFKKKKHKKKKKKNKINWKIWEK